MNFLILLEQIVHTPEATTKVKKENKIQEHVISNLSEGGILDEWI